MVFHILAAWVMGSLLFITIDITIDIRVRLGDTLAVIAGTPNVIAGTPAVIVGTPKLIKRHKFYDGE